MHPPPSIYRYVCTDCVGFAHSAWRQFFLAGSEVLWEMEWQFSAPKTLRERFDDASTSGESVTWTIRIRGDDNSESYFVVRGLWRWSRYSGGFPTEARLLNTH